MIGIDTNVLLRWLLTPDTSDLGSGKAESELVEKTIRAKGARFYVNPIVIAETSWILEQKLKLDRADVCEVVDRLLYSINITVGDAAAVAAARGSYERLNIGFADCLIAGLNTQAGCTHTLTFDRKAGRSPGYRNIRDQKG